MVYRLCEYSGAYSNEPHSVREGIPSTLLRKYDKRTTIPVYTDVGIMQLTFDKSACEVHFLSGDSIKITASVRQCSRRDSDMRIGFCINLKNPGGERWSDLLHAGVFADQMFTYFETVLGYSIKEFDFRWQKQFLEGKHVSKCASDNFTQYKKVKKEWLDAGFSEDEATHEAIFSTWTSQRLAVKHGFSNAKLLREDSEVSGYYYKK